MDSMDHMGERRGRSRSRIQTAEGDSKPRIATQEFPGCSAPLPSLLAESVSKDQGKKRKRKRQTPEEERPSTSSSRAAKRSRRDVYAKGPLLGQGAFGAVFAGIRRADGLPVALKYVPKDESPETLEVDGQGCLPLEVALMSRVSSAPACPSVLQLLEWFDRPSHFVLILERPAPCQDLQSFCEENGCLDEPLAKKVLVQLIAALKHCESRGVLHRDVKPENILISTESQGIKLLDFGCGDLLKRSAYTYFAGSLEYAPPEFFRRQRYYASPATVWSVGVTLFHILCGCFPFSSAQKVTYRSRLLFPRKLSTECRQLIRWCLSPAAADRPSLDDIESHPWLHEQGEQE